MRLLGIDIGDRRTGFAFGDTGTGIVSPGSMITSTTDDVLLEALRSVVSDHRPDAIVVGLPLNMDGTEGPQAKRVRALGERIAGAVERPVHYQDERLTTFAADQSMAQTGLTRGEKKKRRDALAAMEILKDWIEARID